MGQHLIIAAPDEILRRGLHAIFEDDVRVSSIKDVANNEDLHTSLHSFHIDLVILDQALETNLASLSRGQFVVLTLQPEMHILQGAYQHGARGYLSFHASKELLFMILNPSKGTFLIDPTLTSWMMPYLCSTPTRGEDAMLTERQRQVDKLLHSGMKRREIAEHLSIANSTVKTHLKHITQKRTRARGESISSLMNTLS